MRNYLDIMESLNPAEALVRELKSPSTETPIRLSRCWVRRRLKLDELVGWYQKNGFEIADEPAVRGVNIVRHPR